MGKTNSNKKIRFVNMVYPDLREFKALSARAISSLYTGDTRNMDTPVSALLKLRLAVFPPLKVLSAEKMGALFIYRLKAFKDHKRLEWGPV